MNIKAPWIYEHYTSQFGGSGGGGEAVTEILFESKLQFAFEKEKNRLFPQILNLSWVLKLCITNDIYSRLITMVMQSLQATLVGTDNLCIRVEEWLSQPITLATRVSAKLWRLNIHALSTLPGGYAHVTYHHNYYYYY